MELSPNLYSDHRVITRVLIKLVDQAKEGPNPLDYGNSLHLCQFFKSSGIWVNLEVPLNRCVQNHLKAGENVFLCLYRIY